MADLARMEDTEMNQTTCTCTETRRCFDCFQAARAEQPRPARQPKTARPAKGIRLETFGEGPNRVELIEDRTGRTIHLWGHRSGVKNRIHILELEYGPKATREECLETARRWGRNQRYS